jgi:electron transfer flavoprotein alpha/beta subunit
VRVVVVVEQAWDPVSIEVDPVSGGIDWSRAALMPAAGSLEALELGLRVGTVGALFGLGPGVESLLRSCLALAPEARAAFAPDLASLAAALSEQPFDLVLAPQRSGDHGPGLVAPYLAGALDLAQATAVEHLEPGPEAGEVTIRRRLERGAREELVLPLPVVLGVEPGVVTPRAASPAALLAASSAQLPVLPTIPGGRPQARLLGHRPPRPVAPQASSMAPDPTLPAEARIALVAGLAADAEGRSGRELATGSAEEVAARIVDLLERCGYL